MNDIELRTVNLGDYLASEPSRRRRLAELVAHACGDTGIFLLDGHGLDPLVLKHLRNVSTEFFDAPQAYKHLFRRPGTSRGYTPVGVESLAATYAPGSDARPDYKEAFGVGSMDIPERSHEFVGSGLQAVIWPDRPVGFREVWLAYYRAARSLAEQVMVLLADALGVQPALFQSKMRPGADFLRVINYPDQRAAPAAGTLRAGEHTDYGVLTILACDDAPGGLQVRTRDGAWADVPYCPGTLVINIGDLMAYWTGQCWVSAVHRVTNPPPQALGRARRQSIVFFHNPSLDATIDPMHSRSQPGAPRLREVVAGEWLGSRTVRQRLTARDS